MIKQTTIDEKHTEIMNYFHDVKQNIIPSMLEEKAQLKMQLKTLPETQIDKYMEIKDKIGDLSAKIKELKRKEKNYLLEN
jgi:cytoplasmic iron level regulating protein YaaA (DUF328/UPF0246 family)